MDQDDKVCTRETHASVEATRGPARRDTRVTLACGILLAGLYRSRLLSVVRSINDFGVSHVLLIGDFNVPEINWEDSVYLGSESFLAASLFDATNDAYLFQHVTGFTRHRHGQRSSLLDLVFSLNSNSKHSIHHHSPLGSSDHEWLTWQYECVPDIDTVMS